MLVLLGRIQAFASPVSGVVLPGDISVVTLTFERPLVVDRTVALKSLRTALGSVRPQSQTWSLLRAWEIVNQSSVFLSKGQKV